MRAADRDREAAVVRLAAALGEGRIDFAEFDRRSGAVAAAGTVGDLALLTADLPVPAEAAVAERRRRELKEWLAEWRHWLGGAVIMTGIWAVQSIRDGALADYWPAVPLGIWAAVLIAVAIWPSEDD
ncbi:hypothetical protein Ari01nite_00110 [Paractinoplanes rishiriensis]|uniref:DUF1707 domain-containing protein n=2 Tax=Paractinoplanes rishiriensis TaxID=1050105 RepID=A0A919JX31_9ACTN|nr:hypothetical protein Ari01nite_00110 [Actinoplanes rishiriensis]